MRISPDAKAYGRTVDPAGTMRAAEHFQAGLAHAARNAKAIQRVADRALAVVVLDGTSERITATSLDLVSDPELPITSEVPSARET